MAANNNTLSVARALTEAEREAFRSALPLGPGPHTEAEIARAQCHAQLRISATTHEEGPPTLPPENPTRGVLLRPRERPPPIELTEEARRNDINEYNVLLDLRAYSPNRRAVGFSHWNPQQIQEENSFYSPQHPDEARHRSPSPLPEPGSAAYMFAGTMGDDYNRAISPDAEPNRPPFAVIDAYAPRHAHVTDASLRQEQVPDVARRLRALPPPYAEIVIALRAQDLLSWEECFHLVQQSQIVDRLSPMQQEIMGKVRDLRDAAHFGVQIEDMKRRLYHEECLWLFREMRNDGSASYLAAQDWMRRDQNGIGRYVIRDLWWDLIWSFWEDDRPEGVLAQIISNLHRMFRCAMFQRLEDIFEFWLAGVGNRTREMVGINEPGDFWSILSEWQMLMEEAEEFCLIDEEEAREFVTDHTDSDAVVKELKEVLYMLPYPVGVNTIDADIDYDGVPEAGEDDEIDGSEDRVGGSGEHGDGQDTVEEDGEDELDDGANEETDEEAEAEQGDEDGDVAMGGGGEL